MNVDRLKMMKTCPISKRETLTPEMLEEFLRCSRCSDCGGVWIAALDYQEWLRHHGENLPEKPMEQGMNLVSGETHGPRYCPDCNWILMKYKVGHSINFSLNRCAHCGGMWFDQNEWDILKARNLHDDVHLVFSQQWQALVREEEHIAAVEACWRNQFGEADFKEIQRIKHWLQTHPKSAELYAYLLDRDGARKPVRQGIG
jgi:Zn-finger nucleic acid-binding protein